MRLRPVVGLRNVPEHWQRSLFPPQLCPRCVEPRESQNLTARGKKVHKDGKKQGIKREEGKGGGRVRDCEKLSELVRREGAREEGRRGEKNSNTKPNIQPLDMRSFPGVLELEVNKI